MIPFDELSSTAVSPRRTTDRRTLRGDWHSMTEALRVVWPLVTLQDIVTISGGRDALMRVLKRCYGRSYGQIDREVSDFELRDVRTANVARVSQGIPHDG